MSIISISQNVQGMCQHVGLYIVVDIANTFSLVIAIMFRFTIWKVFMMLCNTLDAALTGMSALHAPNVYFTYTHSLVRSSTLCFGESIEAFRSVADETFHFRVLFSRAVYAFDPSFLIKLRWVHFSKSNCIDESILPDFRDFSRELKLATNIASQASTSCCQCTSPVHPPHE